MDGDNWGGRGRTDNDDDENNNGGINIVEEDWAVGDGPCPRGAGGTGMITKTTTMTTMMTS